MGISNAVLNILAPLFSAVNKYSSLGSVIAVMINLEALFSSQISRMKIPAKLFSTEMASMRVSAK